MIFKHPGPFLRGVFRVQERVVTYITVVAVLFLTLLHDIVEMIVGGGHAVHFDGNPVTRTTKDGDIYHVKEPSLVKELVGVVIGGTTRRDKNGHPLTDDEGNHLKNPGFLTAMMVKLVADETGTSSVLSYKNSERVERVMNPSSQETVLEMESETVG